MIDRHHLRYFLWVLETGNFSRAVAACNVSQPILSVGISKLKKVSANLSSLAPIAAWELTEIQRLICTKRTLRPGYR